MDSWGKRSTEGVVKLLRRFFIPVIVALLLHLHAGSAAGQATIVPSPCNDVSACGGREDSSAVGSALVRNLSLQAVAREVIRIPGDPRLGRDLFVQLSCMYCHPASPEDATIAPYLGGVSDRYGRAGLAASVMHREVDPARRFEIHWFDMKDGTSYKGTVIREDDDIMEISDATGAVSFLHKDRVAARGTYEESVTPRGLVDYMTLDELAALLAYLESLDTGGGGN